MGQVAVPACCLRRSLSDFRIYHLWGLSQTMNRFSIFSTALLGTFADPPSTPLVPPQQQLSYKGQAIKSGTVWLGELVAVVRCDLWGTCISLNRRETIDKNGMEVAGEESDKESIIE